MESGFADLREFIALKLKEIDDFSIYFTCLEDKVRKFENTIDEVDAYERHDTVIITGTGLHKSEIMKYHLNSYNRFKFIVIEKGFVHKGK